MKKAAIILIALFLATVAQAQIRWGVKTGADFSNIHKTSEGEKVDGYKIHAGYHLGVVLEYAFSEGYDNAFCLQPELLYVRDGSNYKFYDANSDTYNSGKLVFNELMMPINAKYKFKINQLNCFATAGVYFAYIAKGLNKPDNQTAIDLYDSGDYSRFDCGVGAGLGIEAHQFTFGLSYRYGLVDLTRPQSMVTTCINSLMLSVGYFFKQ